MNSKDDARRTLLESLLTGDLGAAITNQEARGQAALVRSQNLPLQCGNCTREQLESLGIKFGDDVDDLFVSVELPEGWKIERTDHSMHSNLVDNKGRVRGGIFYKAAFYDRSAHLSMNRRYNYGEAPVTGWGDGYESGVTPFWGFVTDCGEIIWHTNETAAARDYDAKERLSNMAKRYLDVNYPEYANPLAYWDEE